LIVGGLATVGVVVTWQQKSRADRRMVATHHLGF